MPGLELCPTSVAIRRQIGTAPAESSSRGGRSIRGAEGARLIALNMALNGTPREETDQYLADHFELDDRGRLLDEVYASVES